MNTALGTKPSTPEPLAEFIITKPRNDNLLICTSGDHFILTGLIKVLSKLTDQPFSPSGLTLFSYFLNLLEWHFQLPKDQAPLGPSFGIWYGMPSLFPTQCPSY